MKPRTVQDVIANLPKQTYSTLPAPQFIYTERQSKVACGVATMKEHMTDEGFQITEGLHLNGYTHAGFGLPFNSVDMKDILRILDPGTLVLQDKREWGGDASRRSFRDPRAKFHNVDTLKYNPQVFSVAILKDSHQNPPFHIDAAIEQNCHAWIIYYHPKIVKALASYVREYHLVRTYHTLDSDIVPVFNSNRSDIPFFSGAISSAYPLRARIVKSNLPIYWHKHPGYHRNGCNTPAYLELLSQFKVAICTSSRYGYALRKIIEATACGCRVITDLPLDETLPQIDGNLIRVSPDVEITHLKEILSESVSSYDPNLQLDYSNRACDFYDYRSETYRLSQSLSSLRKSYNG